MAWETTWAEAELARRFVHRVSSLSLGERRPALAPILDRDPYLSAWTNVQSALGALPESDRARLDTLTAQLDAELDRVDMLPSLRDAAKRSVRALLASPRLLTQESLGFVYQPFERVIPLASLDA